MNKISYEEFMKQYDENHACCPNCGTKDNYNTTLVGYIYYEDRPEEYRDLNTCTCLVCGDRHTKHDRMSIKAIKFSSQRLNDRVAFSVNEEMYNSLTRVGVKKDVAMIISFYIKSLEEEIDKLKDKKKS